MNSDATALKRIGVSESTTSTWTLDTDLANYAKLGVAAIGVWLQKLERPTMNEFWFPEAILDESHVREVAKAVSASGLDVSHVVASGRYTEADDDQRRARVAHTVRAVEWTAILGGACLIIESGDLNGLSRRGAIERSAQAIGQILAETEESPVRMAIEPVKDVDFITTLDEALDLVELIDHPRFGVYVDVCHIWQDTGVSDAIERSSGHILGVHVADLLPQSFPGARLAPGDGVVPIGELITAIETTGYTGSYDIELFTMEAPVADPESLLERCVIGLTAILNSVLRVG